jgi:hypothetical protein
VKNGKGRIGYHGRRFFKADKNNRLDKLPSNHPNIRPLESRHYDSTASGGKGSPVASGDARLQREQAIEEGLSGYCRSFRGSAANRSRMCQPTKSTWRLWFWNGCSY